MRNLKKALVLVLTLAMVLGIMVVGAGAAFNDQSEIDTKHQDAVEMAGALNIINGYPDGSFKPNGNVTREEMAKMICILDNGGKEPQLATGSTFTDVAPDRWSNKYIEACAARGVVSGVGNNQFNPAGNVTATQAAKMLLVELGYDEDLGKYTGSNWATNVNIDATKKGYYEDLEDIDVTAPLSREHAAQMIWNALQADEVEYDYTLIGDSGNLSSKIDVKDKLPLTQLIEDKYDASVEVGYMTGIAYDADKGEYSYTINSGANFGGAAIPAADDPYFGGALRTTADYSDLYGMKVKIAYKDTKTVYGIYATESSVLHSGIVDELPTMADGTLKTVKIDGTTYDLDDTRANTVVYEYNNGAGGWFDTYAAPGTVYYNYVLIDNDDNNCVNCMVAYPVIIGTITYLQGDKFTEKTSAGSVTKNLADVNMYSGAAKDDYFVKTLAANAVGTKDVYTKLDPVISGKVTSVKTNSYTVDGNAYDYSVAQIPGGAATVAAGDTIKEAAVYNTFSFYAKVESAVNVDDYAVLIKYAAPSGMNNTQVKLLFTDGTEKIADLDTAFNNNVNGYAVGTTHVNGALGTGVIGVGDLVTYDTNKDKYQLTPASNNKTNAGFDKVTAYDSGFGTATPGTYNYKSDMKSTINGDYFDATAVVFVYDAGEDEYSVITGEKMAKNATANVTKVINAYADEQSSSGYNRISLARIDMGTITSDDVKYGYVTSDVSTMKNADGDRVLTFSLFDGTQTTTVETVKGNYSGFNPTTGSIHPLLKGDIVKYTLDGDSIDLDSAYTLANGNVSALTQYNGTDEVSYRTSTGGTEWVGAILKQVVLAADPQTLNKEIDKDTVILCIDNDAVEGIPGGTMDLATETPAGNYYANLFVILRASDPSKVDLIVFGNDILNQM